MNKILNINKPSGMTSFDVVATIRRKLGVKKVGHCGTLDPMAKGVLVVLIGDATKRQKEFLWKDKEYIAKIALGFSTDTFDLEGKVTHMESSTVISDDVVKSTPQRFVGANKEIPSKITVEKVRSVLRGFTGEVNQKVPMYSAVKVKGKRLYELARKGIDLGTDIPVRNVTIHDIDLVRFEREMVGKVEKMLPVITIRVVCGSGTYIRSLANDIGNSLGTYATLVGLVRTRVGDLTLKDSISMASLTNMEARDRV